MSFQRSGLASSQFTPLSEIIGLEPEKEPWCVGHASSQNRRCQARTNAHGRSVAMMLLNEGTKDLRAGRCIDTLLDDLAPHVICKNRRNGHQAQAPGLTCHWKARVRTYLDSRAATATPSTRPMSLSSRNVDVDTARWNIEERTARLNESARELESQISMLRRRSQLVLAHPPPSRREGGSTGASAVVSSSSEGSTSSRNTSPEHSVDMMARGPSTESTYQSTTAVSRPAEDTDIWQTVPQSVLAARDVVPAWRTRVSSGTGIQESRNETPQARRREVEGDCGICLCELHISHQDAGEGEEEREHSGEDDHNGDDQNGDGNDDGDGVQNRDDDDDNDDDEPQDAELVWCKARCGVNFHKRCIDQWLQTADARPTCPSCRRMWRR